MEDTLEISSSNAASFLDGDDSWDEEEMYDFNNEINRGSSGESKTGSLQRMYRETFPRPSGVVDFEVLLRGFENVFNQIKNNVFGENLIRKYYTNGNYDTGQLEEMHGMLIDVDELPSDNAVLKRWKLAKIEKDYNLSPLGWDAFVEEYNTIKPETLAERIIENFVKEPREKVSVDIIKKKRLLKCISFAICVGLNYQELEKFEAKVPMSAAMRPLTYPMTLADVEHLKIRLYDLTEDELGQIGGFVSKEQSKKVARIDVLGLGMELPEDPFTEYIPFNEVPFKKVNIEDMWADPYWKGMCVYTDLPDGYVSLWNLNNVFSFEEGADFFVNPTKRKTLQFVRSVASNSDIRTHMEGSYSVYLDNLSNTSIKKLCGLQTLQKAPRVLEAADEYFRRGYDNLEESYRIWQLSNNSFKLYKRDDLKPVGKPFFTPEIDYTRKVTVDEIISGNLSNLAGLITFRNNDNHDVALHQNKPVLVPGAPDVDFQKALSAAFEEMGFLPPGYVRYCGVTRGEPTQKRERSETEGAVGPTKRPREKLFTAIEIH